MNYCIGIDLGGTTISAGIFSSDLVPISSSSMNTLLGDGKNTVLERIAELISQLVTAVPCSTKAISSIGLTVPGLIESEKGPVVFAPNVGWENTDPVPFLECSFGCPVYLFHDAACAAVAESRFSRHGQKYKSFLLLTLGTAIGGALIWDGKLFSQHGRHGSELGHIPLRESGVPCSCGLPGCFQQYGSAPALVRQATAAMQKHPESMLWEMSRGASKNITPPVVFRCATEGDETALQVIDRFTTYLAEGIAGLINIFRPEAVIIGGGLSNAGEALLSPVREKLFHCTHASERIGVPPLLRAELGDQAGMLGAALLAAEMKPCVNMDIKL